MSRVMEIAEKSIQEYHADMAYLARSETGRQPMTLVDLLADYVVLHLTADHRHDLAEFVEAYLEELTNE